MASAQGEPHSDGVIYFNEMPYTEGSISSMESSLSNDSSTSGSMRDNRLDGYDRGVATVTMIQRHVRFDRRDQVQYFSRSRDIAVCLQGSTSVRTKTRKLDFRETILREVESRLFVKGRVGPRIRRNYPRWPILKPSIDVRHLPDMSNDVHPTPRSVVNDDTSVDTTSQGTEVSSDDATSTDLSVCSFNPAETSSDPAETSSNPAETSSNPAETSFNLAEISFNLAETSCNLAEISLNTEDQDALTVSETSDRQPQKVRCRNPFKVAVNAVRAAFNGIKRRPLPFNFCRCIGRQDTDNEVSERRGAADLDQCMDDIQQN